MTTYKLIVRAEIEAKNFDSAQKKADGLKEAVAKKAEISEVELKPEQKA